jgi:hypothetical protein
MNDMVLAPVGCVGLWDAVAAFEPAAKTGEVTVDARRTPAVPASMSRRDTEVCDAFDVSFMFMFQVVEKTDQVSKAN